LRLPQASSRPACWSTGPCRCSSERSRVLHGRA
jgi:hypothetical protein